jgi:hypothetical protein
MGVVDSDKSSYCLVYHLKILWGMDVRVVLLKETKQPNRIEISDSRRLMEGILGANGAGFRDKKNYYHRIATEEGFSQYPEVRRTDTRRGKD